MRIGAAVAGPGNGRSLASFTDDIQTLEGEGYASVWMANHLGADAMTLIALAGVATERIELGTAVVPTYTRHPLVMAQQALTTALACGGRFSLGIGLSTRFIVEDFEGLAWEKPVQHTREYLTVLSRLLDGEDATFDGTLYRIRLNDAPYKMLSVGEVTRPPVLVGALLPAMLKLTGRIADGTITWMCGPRYIESTVVPAITEGARSAGRPGPRVVVGLPIAVTHDTEGARAAAAASLAAYGRIYSYRKVLEAEGAASPADVAIIGDETAVRRQLERLSDLGVTDLSAHFLAVPGDDEAVSRTRAFLGDLARA